MKKLMIAFAIITVGIAANAASIVWSATNIFKPGSMTDKILKDNGLVYLVCSQDTSASAITGYLSDTKTSLADKVASLNAASIGSTALNLDGKISNVSTAWTKAAGSYNFYAVIFEDNAVKAGGKYVVTALSDATAWDNTSDSTLALGNQKTLTQTAANWATVAGAGPTPTPEPTSGLLLLLGVAGMALRRRRA